MKAKIVAYTFLGLFLVLALVSCASVSVEDGTERATQKMPEMIYVLDFGTAHSDFQVDRTGPELAEFKKNLQLMLKTAMVTDLTDRLAPAVPGTKSDWSRNKNAWLVRGEFIKVCQGSRLLRGAIGFGAGRTVMDTRVSVYDLAQSADVPFLTFSTLGGSGAEPGAVTAIATDPAEIAVQIAVGGVSGVAHGLTEDTKRTAREITAEFSNYMYQRGWIPESQWIKPKHRQGGDVW